MKLIIQIPCYNEELTLPLVFEKMPRSIPGIDCLEYQLIDDGSTDRTVEVAKALGVHHIVSIKGKNRRWLGRAFRQGIENALRQGADIVVNTDGDNQYPSDEIANLVQPILAGKADIVIGDRSPATIQEFSPTKKFLQWFGNKAVELVTNCEIRDAVSGFRAYSRESLLQINIVTNYTYTVDTLVQALQHGLVIEWHPIHTNLKTRESRLIANLFSKVRLSGATLIRLSTAYQPFKTFLLISLFFLIPGILLLSRYLFFFLFIEGGSDGHLQSIIASGVCLILGFLMILIGVLGDLLAINRIMINRSLTKIRRLELEQSILSKNLLQ